MDILELEGKLDHFRQKNWLPWPALRFRPSGYDEVFHLCMAHLSESFDELKANNFEIGVGPDEPPQNFYLTLDMLEHVSKSIHHRPLFPWKAPLFLIGVAVLFFLFASPYEPFLWWLVLAQSILSIVMTLSDAI